MHKSIVYAIIGIFHCTENDTEPVPLNLTCDQSWDDETGIFTYKVDWTVPDDENVALAIGSFDVIMDLVGPQGNSRQIQNTYQFDVSGEKSAPLNVMHVRSQTNEVHYILHVSFVA